MILIHLSSWLSYWLWLIPFKELNDFFKQFNMPFTFDLYLNSPAMSLESAFIIDETGLITKYHVIAGSDEINVKIIWKHRPSSRNYLEAPTNRLSIDKNKFYL